MSPVFLIGFMAAGKTTVGVELARRLGRPFVDLDGRVEAEAGMTVREIFAAEGEAGFRARERRALDEILARGDAVVATGGGTPSFGDALARMRAAGPVVALTAPLAELLARVDDPATRPLLGAAADETRALHARRAPVYRRAHFGVDTSGRDAAEVARLIEPGLAALASLPEPERADAVVVALGERSYPIVVADGALASLGDRLRHRLGDRCRAVGIVTDDNVAPLQLARVAAELARAGLTTCHAVIPAGEAHKRLAEVERVAQTLAPTLDRRSAVLALGGGVVGDLAGFVAATLFRGVPVVQAPTTLVAMIDSAIGGKTGVDLAAGKNLVGAFWQPTLVVADPATLVTLPARERRAAVGELVKVGLLEGEELFTLAAELAPALAAGVADPDRQIALIRRCAAAKAWVVSRDERETTGDRILLNLGHTVGHAIEAAAGYGTVLHGECVALGLVAACRVSARLGLCDALLEERTVNALRGAGLDVDLAPWLRDDVLGRIGVDKKRTGSHLRFVALRGVGAAEPVEIAPAELTRILRL
jgi:shikimate kinase/3-dehydroquinate synthase